MEESTSLLWSISKLNNLKSLLEIKHIAFGVPYPLHRSSWHVLISGLANPRFDISLRALLPVHLLLAFLSTLGNFVCPVDGKDVEVIDTFVGLYCTSLLLL